MTCAAEIEVMQFADEILFSLDCGLFPNDTEDLDDDYSEYEGIPYTGKELTGYRDVIRDAIYEDVKDFYGDLMRYYREDDSVRRKVVRAIPTVDEVNGELVGLPVGRYGRTAYRRGTGRVLRIYFRSVQRRLGRGL